MSLVSLSLMFILLACLIASMFILFYLDFVFIFYFFSFSSNNLSCAIKPLLGSTIPRFLLQNFKAFFRGNFRTSIKNAITMDPDREIPFWQWTKTLVLLMFLLMKLMPFSRSFKRLYLGMSTIFITKCSKKSPFLQLNFIPQSSQQVKIAFIFISYNFFIFFAALMSPMYIPPIFLVGYIIQSIAPF